MNIFVQYAFLLFLFVFGCSALLVLAYAVHFYVGIMSTFLKLKKKHTVYVIICDMNY